MATKKCSSDSTVQTSKFLPFHIDDLTSEMIKKAENELHETPEKRQECLKEIRRLIHAEKDFRPLMDEKFLLRFLRSRKYDSEIAMKTLKNYYTFKVRYSRVLTDILPSEMEHVYNLNLATILPYRDNEGSAIMMGKLGLFDLNKATIDELFASILVSLEFILQSEASQICGLVIIVDLKGLTLKLVRHIASPTLLYRVVRVLQDCTPARIKAIHVVHEPFYFSIVFNIIKKLLSEKMKKRIQFHGNNLQHLHSQIPPQILPSELGGLQGPLDNRAVVKEILSLDNYYAKIFKYGYQEKRAQFIKKKSSMSFGLFL